MIERSRSRVPLLAAALTLPLALPAMGCKRKGPGGPLPICEAKVAGGAAVEAEAQELPADIWFSIMLQGFDREQMLPGDDPKDCTGTSTNVPTPPPLAEGEEPPAEDDEPDPFVVADCPIGGDQEVDRLPARPLTEDDIVINDGPDGKTLVWVQATHYENGEASGPAALIEWTKAGVAVRALGSLRAQTYKARMRIELAGETQVLVVESDECNTEEKKLCKRIMKLLPVLNGRFATVPLKAEESGECLGEAAFALSEQYTSDLPDGWIRNFSIVRSVTFDDGEPLVSEQVVIKDKDPNQPEAPAQDFREASNDRRLSYVDRYFETRPSLWEEMIQNYGSVAHDAEEDE